MDPGGRGDPMFPPIFFQQRPQHLIDVLAVPADRAAQNPFLDGAELPERGVAATVLKQDARFEPPRADGAERKGSNETDRFDEDTRASRRGREGAFPFPDFKRRIQPSNLDEADGTPRLSGG